MSHKITKQAAVSLLGAAAVLGLAAGSALAAEKWDMPMAYSATNFHSATGAEFAACITTGTGGEIEVVTHPSGSLFKGADIKRAIQTGQAPIGERLLSGNQNENALFGMDSVPFLATSFDDAAKLWKVYKPVLTEVLDAQGLVLLYSVPWPPQGLYFKKEVNSVGDMKGVKFRSYNAATARLAELAGMLPVTIEAAEISQAFATGVADSMISSGSTGYDRKVWESLTHFYEVDAWLPRNYIMVNKDVWGDTSAANQNIIKGCAGLAEYAGTWRAVEYTQFTLNGLKAGGMTVGPAGDQLKADLKKIGETMTAEWLEKTGAQGKTVVDAFKAMQ
jgi:TRAP-type C4-dicarboxylate transport system substrate-binding protein